MISSAPEAQAEVHWLLDSQLVATNRLAADMTALGYVRAAQYLQSWAGAIGVALLNLDVSLPTT